MGINAKRIAFSNTEVGILSLLLDTTMTASVLSSKPKGVSRATVEMKVNFIQPVMEKTGLLRCEACPIYLGKRLATAEGRVRNQRGAILAHGVNTCAIFRYQISQ